VNSLRDALIPGRGARTPALLAAALALLAIVASTVLLALAGWLITATALAGLGLLLALELFAPGAGIRAAALLRTVARYFERLIGHDATLHQLAKLRVQAFDALMRTPIERLRGLARGDALTRLTRDIDTLDHLLPRLLLPTIATLSATLLVAVWLALLAPELGAVIAACFLTAGTMVLGVGTLRARRPGRALASATPRLRARLTEWLEGRAELDSLNKIETFGERVLAAGDVQLEAERRQRRIEAAMQTALSMAGGFGVCLVLLLGLSLHAAGELNAPLTAAAVLATLALVDAWTPMAPAWSFVETARRAARRVDGIDPGPGTAHTDGELEGVPKLEVCDLRFRYADHLPELFGGLSLTLAPGDRMLIRGASGRGKSTLGRVLAGLIDPDRGRVLLGGRSPEHLSEAALRRALGWMPQDITLFHDSVAANLRLSAPDADDARLIEVLHGLELGAWLESLPDGLDSRLGESGGTVSGGQARRLALARMVLADFPVLILDEPMAGLDAATRQRIGVWLDVWFRERTVVVLSHDPDPLPGIDQVLDLDRP